MSERRGHVSEMSLTKLLSINAYVTACYTEMLSEIIVSPLCYKCSAHCPQKAEFEIMHLLIFRNPS